MCGIAGLIHRGQSANIGREMTMMLQSMKHRGPDSTGYALYGKPREGGYVMRVKLAEQSELQSGFAVHERLRKARMEVETRLKSCGVKIAALTDPAEYALRIAFDGEADLKKIADYLEDIPGAEILSLGHAVEVVKDLGDAETVGARYQIGEFQGTHAIGHTRMATESAVDIRSAHPYWAYPFADIAVVHNGQLTNYWTLRREMERKGRRFLSDCDSELVAVYVADRMSQGDDLEAAMRRSVEELDGVFTYLVATADALGMAKDTMAAKPLVLFEGDDFVALASEEVAIRNIVPREIDTCDPYEGEVMAWKVAA
jgi:glutamate synthase domain-containing protein 1